LPHCRFSVPHDRLFLDALERDLKREKMGLDPTTYITGEPAMSFIYDSKRSLYEQFCKTQGGYESEAELEATSRTEELAGESEDDKNSDNSLSMDENPSKKRAPSALLSNPNTPFASMFSLFEGSPTYKQRRKKTTKKGGLDGTGRSSSMDESSEQYLVGPPVRDTNRMTAADLFMAQARGKSPLNEPAGRSLQLFLFLLNAVFTILSL
jgi:transcription factor STE12